MGLYQALYSTHGASIEFADLEVLDLVAERTQAPGLDDVMGEPFLLDRGDGVGAVNRPTKVYTLRCKIEFTKGEEQALDQTGNDPDSEAKLTLYPYDLEQAGLLVAGAMKLKSGDRLARIRFSDGIIDPTSRVRIDFKHGGRTGLRAYDVRHGTTGDGVVIVMFESQRQSQLGIG